MTNDQGCDDELDFPHKPLFLTMDDILQIHHNQIKNYGGLGGIRDMGLLESALAQPSSGSGDEYYQNTLHEMAAAYVHHIVMNHPFLDGNKRVGAMAAYVFLRINGKELDAEEKEFEKLIRTAASGQIDKSGIAEFIKNNCLSNPISD